MDVDEHVGSSKGGEKATKETVDPIIRKDSYVVKAPSMFTTQHIGEIPVNRTQETKIESEGLKYSVFEVSPTDLQNDNDGERSFCTFCLTAEDVQGRNVPVNFHGMDLTTDKLQSMVKICQTLIEANVDVETTDGYLPRVFCIGFTNKDQMSQTKPCCAQQTQVHRHHLTQHKAAVPCRDLSEEFVADTLQAHQPDLHLKDQCPILGMSCPFRDYGCRFKGSRHALEKHVDDNIKQHLLLMCGMVSKQQQQIDRLIHALSPLSLNYAGILNWKISDYTSKLTASKMGKGIKYVSVPFYTSRYGYKLKASVFLNGNGPGEGSHISVYATIIPGEYDALLSWPFVHSISFTLFDQSSAPESACNIVKSFIPDPAMKNFQCPTKEPDSFSCGFPCFVSHTRLKKRHFLKDDTMFILVKVHIRKTVAVQTMPVTH